MSFDYDFFVIGAGSGGVRAARMAAGFGARVAVAENRYLGGTCVNVGCVPKKLFVYGSHFSHDFELARSFGWDLSRASFSWPTLRDNKTQEIERLNRVYRGILDKAGVAILEGTASFRDQNTVVLNNKPHTARYILIATGGWPFIPEFPGSEHAIDSNAFFYLDKLPDKVAIVGGGYIAVEFAGILNGLGVETTLIYRRDLFLRGFDTSVRQFLKKEMEKKGVRLWFNTNVSAIEKTSEGYRASLDNGETLDTGLVLYATGRKPLTENLGLKHAGVETAGNGAVKVDDTYQTSTANIYAVGDVIDRVALTPVALAEGMCVANRLFNNNAYDVSYDYIPSAVFSQPAIGTVGLSEDAAVEKYGDDISVFETDFKPMKYSLGGSDERTLMKLVVQKSTDRVLGAHMVGSEAGEIMQGIAVALKAGATKAVFDQTIGIHPTSAEEFVTMREPVR
ncbi:MAG: glutathione-disulfide reductase [Ketobacteraceae bacterium]|nr:glutathione-disulfide reductase [Ketobacteraceae bacterium]